MMGSFWRSRFRVWKTRLRDRADLCRLSEFELRDIGLDPSSAVGEATRPFWRPCPRHWEERGKNLEPANDTRAEQAERATAPPRRDRLDYPSDERAASSVREA